MKSLARTIDRIIRVDPAFESHLSPLKVKVKKYPKKNMTYWDELLKFFNSEALKTHPKINEIRNIIVSQKKQPKPMYTFEEVSTTDRVIGFISENIADRIRRYDRQSIRLAKKQVEVNLTHNSALFGYLARQNALNEIKMKRIWFDLKDQFDLWNITQASNWNIKMSMGALVLVESTIPEQQQMPQGMIFPMKMNPESLRNFLRQFGLDLPDSESL